MKRNTAFVLVAVALMWAGVSSPSDAALDGNALLREAASRHPWPKSYSVPMHFKVQIHRPIPAGVQADAIAYFKGPNQQALVITSLPRILTRRIGSAYANLDTVPQAWPAKYRVTRVEEAVRDGEPLYRLHAVPNYSGVRETIFDLVKKDLTPIGATWFFTDGSVARLTVRNGTIGGYSLPLQEDIDVSMPRVELHASGQSGTYTLNTALPKDVFSSR